MIKPFDKMRNNSSYLKTQELGHVVSLRPIMFFQSLCLFHVQSEPYSEPHLGDLMEILRFCSLKMKLLNGFALLDLEIKKS